MDYCLLGVSLVILVLVVRLDIRVRKMIDSRKCRERMRDLRLKLFGG